VYEILSSWQKYFALPRARCTFESRQKSSNSEAAGIESAQAHLDLAIGSKTAVCSINPTPNNIGWHELWKWSTYSSN